MEKFATDNLILIEFLVDNICFEYSVQQSLKCMQGETCVAFQFLDNAPLYVCEEDFAPKSRNYVDSCGGCSSMKNGKSCLFALNPTQADECMKQFDIYVEVFRKMPKGVTPEKMVLGESLISILNLFHEMVSAFNVSEDDTPVAKTLKDCFKIQNASGELVGRIGVYIRMSTFGKLIVTQFQMNLQDKSVEFKAKEGHYLFTTKTNKAEPEKNQQIMRESLSTKNAFDMPCGVPKENPKRPCMGEKQTCPRPPPPCAPSAPCAQPMGPPQMQPPQPVGPPGGYMQPAAPPPCAQPPCAPPPCGPQPPCAPQGPQQPFPQQTAPFPLPYPQPNMYPSQGAMPSSFQQQGNCPMCGQCPPMSCPQCGQSPAGPPNGLMNQPGSMQMQPMTNSMMSTPCIECAPGAAQQSDVPPPPDCDYQEFGAEMGGNSLIIRVHKDKAKVEQVTNEVCCCEQGGKPKPAVYQVSTPSPCYCINQGGVQEMATTSPAGDNNAVCPSCCPDNNTPFTFKLGGTTQADNNISILSPNNNVKPGGKLPPLADPTKEVFVLRIGKKNETASKKNNMEIELCTPRGKEYKPPLKKMDTEMQCDPVDEDELKKGKKGKKGKKDGKKGGKKGKKK